jgi:hypothetical protein
MKVTLGIVFISLFFSGSTFAQELKTKNVIIITLDGYRWKELFKGADQDIVLNRKFIRDTTVRQFADPSPAVSREKLMPFFWNIIGKQGQLYGNRKFKNKVNCANTHLISYPGYSEMLVGFPDRKVSSNDKVENPNATVLEFIHKHNDFNKRVAAFTTWDAFPFILREEKAGILVNSGHDLATGELSQQEKWLNENQGAMNAAHGPRLDAATFRYAIEFLKRERPRVLFLGFDETDHYAHGGRYDEYLKAAHRADQMIAELWQWVQSQPDYKDQTTLFITTDHGRGSGKTNWKNHRLIAPGSGQIWFAVLGPDTPAFGEMKFSAKYKQKQVAKTIAAFLGLNYKREEPVGDVVQTMLAVPTLNVEDTSANNK